jgi:hypothetical protein
MIKKLFFAALLTLVPAFALADTVFIGNDMGGEVDQYTARWKRYSTNGDTVVIDGDCVSACARFVSLPKVCAIPGAHFYFHGITVGDKHALDVPASIRDSAQWETRKAFLLQQRFGAFAFGRVKSVTRVTYRVADGVWVTHIFIPSENLWMKFLKVDATKLVPTCAKAG